RQLVTARLVSHKLGPQQFWALLNLHDHDGSSVHELAVKTWSDDPTMCRMMSRLAARGLVRMEDHPSDRRRFQVRLTARGRQLAAQLTALAQDLRGGIVSVLSPKERRQLCEMLKRLIANAEQMGKETPAEAPPAPARRARGSR